MTISPDGRLLCSGSLDGSLAVYDLTNHTLIAHVHDHIGPTNGVAWVDDDLWTFGDDGAVKHWAVRNGTVTLRHTINVNGRMYLVRAVRGLWAANAGDRVLVIGRDDDAIALRLDLGRAIDALDVSPDQRYVAAGVHGEIVVIDLQRNAIATMTVGFPYPSTSGSSTRRPSRSPRALRSRPSKSVISNTSRFRSRPNCRAVTSCVRSSTQRSDLCRSVRQVTGMRLARRGRDRSGLVGAGRHDPPDRVEQAARPLRWDGQRALKLLE